MTRVNCVPATELCRQHLIAEYRELPRVFGLVRAAEARGLSPALIRAPAEYTLGAGHVLFFYSRLMWLSRRYGSLVGEMERRGYSPSFTEAMIVRHADLHDHWWGMWEPTEEALRICRARIAERMPASVRSHQ